MKKIAVNILIIQIFVIISTILVLHYPEKYYINPNQMISRHAFKDNHVSINNRI